jgi:hypothetical protein
LTSDLVGLSEAENVLMTDYAIHSDFLVHWTGKDIDKDHHPKWESDVHSKTGDRVTELYLDRLRDILTYGLWMSDEGARKFRVGSSEIVIPPTPQCCFTELKLSESRRHASLYGRLGIGVKRPFAFERSGRPVAYFGFHEGNHNDKFLDACHEESHRQKFAEFFQTDEQPASTIDLRPLQRVGVEDFVLSTALAREEDHH